MKPYSLLAITLLSLTSFPVLMKSEPNQAASVQQKIQMIYVVGEVCNPGGFPLAESETVVRAISKAGGLSKNAMASQIQIIRRVDGARPMEIPVNLKDILMGKKSDIFMQPEDILSVPSRNSSDIKQLPIPPGDLLFIPGSYAKNEF